MCNRYGVSTCFGSQLISAVSNLEGAAKDLRGFLMDTIAASYAKNRFRALLDKVQVEPVIISRHGKPIAVVMSAVEFDTHLSFKPEAPDGSDHRCAHAD
jgi:prevent-host-death family protein